MSMTSLRLLQDAYKREDDAVYGALEAFTVKDMPSFKEILVGKVTMDKKGCVVIEGGWQGKGPRESSPYRASVAIDPKTGKGTITGRFWAGFTGTHKDGPLSAADRKALVARAHALIEAGDVAASGPARTAIIQLKARR